MITLEHVTHYYARGNPGLLDVSVNIEPGEFVFLVGPTGAGKSTFHHLVRRDFLPTEGRVLIGGKDTALLPQRDVPLLRRRIGIIYQDIKLLEKKTVQENIALALLVANVPMRVVRSRTRELLEIVGLEHRALAFPGELSGGEKQKVAMARAIANHPGIILGDEPTGNLDPDSSCEILELLEDINRTGTTVVVSTHDETILNGTRHRVIKLTNGRIVADSREASSFAW